MWHGLKIVYPPQPVFMGYEEAERNNATRLNQVFNGGLPTKEFNGMSHGDGGTDRATRWWGSTFPNQIISSWLEGNEDKLPYVLLKHEGEIWAPAMGLHPVKTNRNP